MEFNQENRTFRAPCTVLDTVAEQLTDVDLTLPDYCPDIEKILKCTLNPKIHSKTLSGGQLQRACICRSMINSPKMIFADEPTGALNRQSSNEVMEELCKINADGTTIMLVTHDAKVAAKCSRVLYIVDGNIQGEYNLEGSDERTKERALNNWLLEQGW